MAFKIGLQDVSYDPDLHTGTVDFDFFDMPSSPGQFARSKNNLITDEKVEGDPQSQICVGMSQQKTGYEVELNGYESNPAMGAVENRGSVCNQELSEETSSDSEPCQQQPIEETRSDNEWHQYPRTETCLKEDADNGPHNGPLSPSSDRLQAVVDEVAVIEQSLQRLRLPAGVGTDLTRGAEATRPRRPRPRSGCPQRKRWSSSLAEAALTQRQIEQLLRADSDSSSSDMVGGSDTESDGVAPQHDVQTWLGAASSGGGGCSAPSGRLGLLADAVRHLERHKPRTAPAAPRRPVRAPHRKNMSFTNEEVRQIDRHNRILLNKIVAQQRRPPARPTPTPTGGARHGTQDQIRRDNMILLQKIRGARPSRSVISGFHDVPPPVRPILERGSVRHRRPWVDC